MRRQGPLAESRGDVGSCSGPGARVVLSLSPVPFSGSVVQAGSVGSADRPFAFLGVEISGEFAVPHRSLPGRGGHGVGGSDLLPAPAERWVPRTRREA